MQKLFLIILGFLPTYHFGQIPSKGDNTVIVNGVTFSKVKEALLDAGIFIDQQNAEDGTIVTRRKGYCNCPNKDFYQLIYFIRVKDSSATIRARFNVILTPKDNDEKEFMELQYWKSKNSVPYYLFEIVTEFAQSLAGSSITFKKL